MSETEASAPITIAPPAELGGLLEVLGSPALLFAFIEEFGGTRAPVPLRATDDCVIARAVGLEATQRLVRSYGGDRIKVPLARHWRICVCRSWGWSVGLIARKFCITEKAVYANLAAARLSEAQFSRCTATRVSAREGSARKAERVAPLERGAARAERLRRIIARNENVRHKLAEASAVIAEQLGVPLSMVNLSRSEFARRGRAHFNMTAENRLRAERYRTIRERLDKAVFAVANECGVSTATVWDIRGGRTKNWRRRK